MAFSTNLQTLRADLLAARPNPPPDEEISPQAQEALRPLVDRIIEIVSKMDWRYRAADNAVIEFTVEDTAPLYVSVRAIKEQAARLRVSRFRLNEFCLPILAVYNFTVKEQGIEQFAAQLDFLENRDHQLNTADLGEQVVRAKVKLDYYQRTESNEHYFIEHVKLKLNLGEGRHDSVKKPTDEEHETGMFLVALYTHRLNQQLD